ncbi:MAG: hypothetical protein K0S45_1787 [Nitrospira sp.]|nr:hypothetical protein [Nitrospira sp.]
MAIGPASRVEVGTDTNQWVGFLRRLSQIPGEKNTVTRDELMTMKGVIAAGHSNHGKLVSSADDSATASAVCLWIVPPRACSPGAIPRCIDGG